MTTVTLGDLTDLDATRRAAHSEYEEAAWGVAMAADLGLDLTVPLQRYRKARTEWTVASNAHLGAFYAWDQARTATAAEVQP